MSEAVDEAALLADDQPAGDQIVIGPDDPNAADVRRLLALHLEFSHVHSPADAVFALDTPGLTQPDYLPSPYSCFMSLPLL
jgi:hypothetical protein